MIAIVLELKGGKGGGKKVNRDFSWVKWSSLWNTCSWDWDFGGMGEGDFDPLCYHYIETIFSARRFPPFLDCFFFSYSLFWLLFDVM